MNKGLDKVSFDMIRYAACWEDADLLVKGLEIKNDATVLCIASGGDNALGLLSQNPAAIKAIDINPHQLYVTELKQRAFQALTYNGLLQLLNISSSSASTRVALYEKLRPLLSEAAQLYWNKHLSFIKIGIIYAGKFEKYFAFFRRYLLPLVHNKKTIAELFKPKTGEAQKIFFEKKWNNRRWRLLMRIFFNRYTMGRYGRDPQFLKQVEVKVSDYIINKAATHLQSQQCQSNYFLQMIMTGRYGDHLPLYLRPENFNAIRKNTQKLVLQLASAEEIMKKEKFSAYVLSNFFEYLPREQFEAFAALSAGTVPSGARVAYWNLMVVRSLHQTKPEAFACVEKSKELTLADKGFFYHRFIIDQKI